MHRSRLIGIMIDCSEDTMEKGVRFWSQALGTVPLKRDDPTGQPFCVAPTWSDADLENARTWDS